MPYIGNQHNVGDHVNNFKVLDDISSHTATFDGSATSVVDTTNNTIRVPEHRFIQGQRVTYTNGGGGNIGGLTTGTAYFVSFDSANTIKLATTLANANSNTVINISAVGSGTSHTLNAAFDGVNTKFKVTYRSGTSARLNNATQLNVAINNVIQRPNQSALSFTEGFAIEDNHKIVFKVAPTVNDIFWGSIIANTIENFDLRDNEVDNFTGDGSTTEFTLSTIPANNESVIVTIDGVLQHPSDKDTVRAYTLIDSILQFTAAPALNAEIQARHIGFAGASTNDVSGFYGRTGNVALTANDHITTGDLTSRNVNVTGILTASSLNFGGNLDANGDLDVDGHTNLDNVSIAGVTTMSGNLTISNTQPSLFLTDTNNNDDYSIQNQNGYFAIKDESDGHNRLVIHPDGKNVISGDLDVDGHTNLDNVSIAGVTTFGGAINGTSATFTGNVSVGGVLTYEDVTNVDSVGIITARDGLKVLAGGANVVGVVTATGADINGDLDVDGHTNLDNGNVAGIVTFNSGSALHTNGGQILLFDRPDGNSNNLFFGTGGKAVIYHDGTNFSQVNNTGHFYLGQGVGNKDLYLYAQASGNVLLQQNTGVRYVKGVGSDASVQLFFNNNLKLNTTNTGINITGTAVATGADINGDLDVDGHTNLDNVSISGVATATSFVGPLTGNVTGTASGNPTLTSGANNRVVTATGANTLTGETGLTYDTQVLRLNNTAANPQFHLTSADNGISELKFGDQSDLTRAVILYRSGSAGDALCFNGYNNTERLRIDSSGRVLIGTTNADSVGSINQNVVIGSTTNAEEVALTLNVMEGTNNRRVKFFLDDDDGVFGVDATASTGVPDFVIRSATSEKLRINSNGMMSIGKTSSAGKAIEIYQAAFAALRIQNSSTGTGNNDGILLEASGSDCLLYNYEAANLKLGTAGTERLVITSGGHVNIGGLYTQTSYGFSVRGGAVDQNVQFSNTKSTNGNIHYIGITLTNGGYGQALFGHTGHTTAGEQAAWMGLAGDDVAGGTGVKCFRGGKVQMGASTTLQAFINNSVSGHQFISQCSDNNNGFEIYQKHGSTSTRKTLAVYANTGNSSAKQIQFEVRGNNTTWAYGTKNTSPLTLSTAIGPSGAHSYGDENRLDFLMYNEVPQFTGNPAARIAGYLQRGNNGYGLRFYARTNASTLFKAMEITADYEVLPGINGSVDLGSSSYRWKNVYTSDLDLSNEAKGGNDVDGTWGSYTIQEGESDLFLINKRNGKKYKFNLTEVS